LIPLSQPYNTAPWNYAGTESVAAIPANVVDWVLVELRDADVASNATPATTLPGWPKAMFLRNDGKIIDLNGNLPKIGDPTISNNLFVVVRHRNHLDVLSNTGTSIMDYFRIYDFSTGINQAYGGSAGYKQLSPSVYGMVQGDVTADGMVDATDFNSWGADFGNSGVYQITDMNLDTNIDASDFNGWAGNFGVTNPVNAPAPGGEIIYKSQVPDKH